MDVFLWVLLIGFLAGTIYFGYEIFLIQKAYRDNDNLYSNARDTYTQKADTNNLLQAPIDVDWESLLKINPDIIGWIYTEGVDISYPILQGSDNKHYLKHTYEGEYSFAGSIFMDYQNVADLSGCNTMIYGHNMRNGSMFGSLKKYSQDNAYAVSPYFWILTPGVNYRYEIQAAYTAQINSFTYTLFSDAGKEFREFLAQMKASSEIQTRDSDFRGDEKVVTLSTCNSNQSTRYVVQGIMERSGINQK